MNTPSSVPHNNAYIIDCSDALRSKITSELYIGENERKYKKKQKKYYPQVYYQQYLNYQIGKQYYLNYPASYNSHIIAPYNSDAK